VTQGEAACLTSALDHAAALLNRSPDVHVFGHILAKLKRLFLYGLALSPDLALKRVPRIGWTHRERVFLATITPQASSVSRSFHSFTLLPVATSSEPRDTADRV
jgi:hypothetical protein